MFNQGMQPLKSGQFELLLCATGNDSMILMCHDKQVHQACYGVSKVPKGRWYCRPCRTSSKDIVRDLNIHNIICHLTQLVNCCHQLLIFCAFSNMSLSLALQLLVYTHTHKYCLLSHSQVLSCHDSSCNRVVNSSPVWQTLTLSCHTTAHPWSHFCHLLAYTTTYTTTFS